MAETKEDDRMESSGISPGEEASATDGVPNSKDLAMQFLDTFDDFYSEVDALTCREVKQVQGVKFKPYTYKYEARELILKKIEMLKDALEKSSEEIVSRMFRDRLETLNYLLGVNMVDTEEVNIAIDILQESVHYFAQGVGITTDSLPTFARAQELRDVDAKPAAFTFEQGFERYDMDRAKYAAWYLWNLKSFIGAANYLGIAWNNWGEHRKAWQILRASETAYIKATDLEISLGDEIPKYHTLTLFYLAQVLTVLGKPAIASRYVCQTLERQLVYKDYRPLDWISNAVDLSEYFINEERFDSARASLMAASAVMKQFEQEAGAIDLSSPDGEQEDEKRCRANLALGWARLWQGKLKAASKTLLSVATEDESLAPVDADDDSLPQLDVAPLEGGESIRSQLKPWMRVSVSDSKSPISMAKSEAYSTMKGAMQQYENAIKFFKLDGFVTDHIMILLDWSHLYSILTTFETEPSIKTKLHKRRVRMLEGMPGKLNPSSFQHLIRQMLYELGQALEDIAEIKEMEGGIARAGASVEYSVQYYVKYIMTFKEDFYKNLARDKKAAPTEWRDTIIMNSLEDDLLRQYLQVKFSLAKLYGRLPAKNMGEHVSNLEKSLGHYTDLRDFNKANPENVHFKRELAICGEMAELLPQKIENLSKMLLAQP